jgi:hypothetical protein
MSDDNKKNPGTPVSEAPTPPPPPFSSPDSGGAYDGAGGAAAAGGDAPNDDGRSSERSDRGLSDFVRRAVSAGVVAASRSKDDIMRAAGGEIRGWLDHLKIDEEITKVLSKMVIEVKTEIRFRSTDDGRVVPETTNDVKVKGSPR